MALLRILIILFLFPMLASAQPGKIYTNLADAWKDPIKVYKLELRKQGLKEIPREVFYMTNLEELYLEKNSIVKLPKEIGLLTKLRILDLDQNQIDSVPAEIGNLILLEELDLDQNKITALPKEIGLLKKLKSLDLHENFITYLPAEIGNLDSLMHIAVQNNRLDSLPFTFFHLSLIESLNLNYNNLVTIPASIGQMNRLKTLTADHNLLIAIPAEIKHCTQLTSVSLQFNALSEIQSALGTLPLLEQLYLNNNLMTEFPESFGTNNRITTLYLSTNKIARLPENLNLPFITYLNLSSNELTSLPENLVGLKSIETLDLSKNKLTTLPAGISQLKKLDFLEVSENSLKKIPKEIGQLKLLTHLHLNSNQLQSLPVEIGSATSLLSLFIYDNPFSTKLKGVEKLINLSDLSISEDKLSYLPEAINKIPSLRDICVEMTSYTCFRFKENYIPDETDYVEPQPEKMKLTKENWLNYLIAELASEEDNYFGEYDDRVGTAYEYFVHASNEKDLIALLQHENASVKLFAFNALDTKKWPGIYDFILQHFDDTQVIHKKYSNDAIQMGNLYVQAKSLNKTQKRTIDSLTLFSENDFPFVQYLLRDLDTNSNYHQKAIELTPKYTEAVFYVARFHRESDFPLLDSFLYDDASRYDSIMDIFPHPHFKKTMENIVSKNKFGYHTIERIMKEDTPESAALINQVIEFDHSKPENTRYNSTHVLWLLNKKNYLHFDSLYFRIWRQTDELPDTNRCAQLLKKYPQTTLRHIQMSVLRNSKTYNDDILSFLLQKIWENDPEWINRHVCDKLRQTKHNSWEDEYYSNYDVYYKSALKHHTPEIAQAFLDVTLEYKHKNVINLIDLTDYILTLDNREITKRYLKILVDRPKIYSWDAEEIKEPLKKKGLMNELILLQEQRKPSLSGSWRMVSYRKNDTSYDAPNWSLLEMGNTSLYQFNGCYSYHIGGYQFDSTTIHFDSINDNHSSRYGSYDLNFQNYFSLPVLATSAVQMPESICTDTSWKNAEIDTYLVELAKILITAKKYLLTDSSLIIYGDGELHLKLLRSYYTDWKKSPEPVSSYGLEPYPVYQEKYYYLSKPPTTLGGVKIETWLARNDIDSISKLFIQGKYGFFDYDSHLEQMLDSVLTDNPNTQYFYFYIFNRVIDIARPTDYYSTTRYYLEQRCAAFFLKNPCYFFEQVKSGPYSYNYLDWKKYLQRSLWNEETVDLDKYGTEYKVMVDCPKYRSEILKIYKWMETYVDPDIPVYYEDD